MIFSTYILLLLIRILTWPFIKIIILIMGRKCLYFIFFRVRTVLCMIQSVFLFVIINFMEAGTDFGPSDILLKRINKKKLEYS